jgi:hypothetical protein
MMIMKAVLAIALGLIPGQPGKDAQTINYRDSDYAGLIGAYRQNVDSRGTTHLRGFDRLTGKPFEVAVRTDGFVEGTVGESYVTFTVRELA